MNWKSCKKLKSDDYYIGKYSSELSSSDDDSHVSFISIINFLHLCDLNIYVKIVIGTFYRYIPISINNSSEGIILKIVSIVF